MKKYFGVRCTLIIYLLNVQVVELESLGGQGMVLCSYDGMLYHGQSAICEKLIADKDLIKSFGSLLQCKCPTNNLLFTYFNIIIHL